MNNPFKLDRRTCVPLLASALLANSCPVKADPGPASARTSFSFTALGSADGAGRMSRNISSPGQGPSRVHVHVRIPDYR
ncbi:MAG: hypothetical protein JO299_08025 [Gammaproteobacteria bacterium]|nr:hypothetical protein [Gammaproteobacteria bacterium]